MPPSRQPTPLQPPARTIAAPKEQRSSTHDVSSGAGTRLAARPTARTRCQPTKQSSRLAYPPEPEATSHTASCAVSILGHPKPQLPTSSVAPRPPATSVIGSAGTLLLQPGACCCCRRMRCCRSSSVPASPASPPALAPYLWVTDTTLPSMTAVLPSRKAMRDRPSQFLKESTIRGWVGS